MEAQDYKKLIEALRETATFEYTGKLLSKRECALETLAMKAADAIEFLIKDRDFWKDAAIKAKEES